MLGSQPQRGCRPWPGSTKAIPCAWLQVFALGFVSVFDQILEGLPELITQEVFKAYVDALQEDPQQFRRSVPAGTTAGAMHLRGGGSPEASRGSNGCICFNVASDLIPQAKPQVLDQCVCQEHLKQSRGVESLEWMMCGSG